MLQGEAPEEDGTGVVDLFRPLFRLIGAHFKVFRRDLIGDGTGFVDPS